MICLTATLLSLRIGRLFKRLDTECREKDVMKALVVASSCPSKRIDQTKT